MAASYTLPLFEDPHGSQLHTNLVRAPGNEARYSHTSEAGLIIFFPLMYCTPPPTLVDTNTLKRMTGGNSPPPNLQTLWGVL